MECKRPGSLYEKKGFMDYSEETDSDIFCIQEISLQQTNDVRTRIPSSEL